jgi:hypothetical protein
MASIFCPSCGSKSEYQFAAPNFCSKCGQPYAGRTSHKKMPISAQVKLRKTQSDEQDFVEDEDSGETYAEDVFSDSTRVPRLRSLQVDIDNSSDVRVVKMSDLLNGNFEHQSLKLGQRQSIDEAMNERETN